MVFFPYFRITHFFAKNNSCFLLTKKFFLFFPLFPRRSMTFASSCFYVSVQNTPTFLFSALRTTRSPSMSLFSTCISAYAERKFLPRSRPIRCKKHAVLSISIHIFQEKAVLRDNSTCGGMKRPSLSMENISDLQKTKRPARLPVSETMDPSGATSPVRAQLPVLNNAGSFSAPGLSSFRELRGAVMR